MLKFYMFIFTGLFTYHLCAQNKTIAVMDFDETAPQWDFSTDIPFFDNNTDGFFGVHNGDGDDDINDTGISMNANNISAINISNDFLFINDLNDEGDHGTGDKATLRFDPVDISNYHHVTIQFDFEVIAFDASDFIIYEIIEDGQITVSDTLAKNTQGSISTQILNKTNTLDFHLIIKQNGVNEYAAIDNIKLQGDPIIPCSELIISEYVEGTSSGTTFRNNFIEIYNPTNSEIELNNYDLVKYTGKNLEPSAALNLNGIIAGYGTFVIEDDTENLGLDSNLSSNSSVMDFTGDDKIALRKSNKIIDLIGQLGDSINFAKDLTLRRKSHIQNPNNQYNPLEWDSYPLEDVSNINTHVTSCSSNIPEIQVMGNAYEIMDGDLHSNFNNNTFFGNINAQQGLHIKKSYSVKNIGNDLLKIDHIEITGTDKSEFLLDNFTDVDINPNDSLVFDIIFTPSSKGIKTAMVNIANNDASENPFNFVIQGEGSGSSDSPLIISQYYEGDGNNRWIEITNTSDAETPDNTYFLALYRNSDAKNPIGIKPTIQKAIPKTSVGQTLKYSASLKVNAPVYAIDGTEIKTNICTFDGDDMLIISTTNDETCWENKIDIIGNSTNWGAEKSFVRKYGCNKVRAKTGFDTNDWLVYEVSEIDAATKGFNQRIGQHFTGAAIFENDQWSNGLPDHYREVIIDHDFHSNIQGNLEACHLTINATKTMHIEADNYLSIQKDLTVNGTLNIWHEGSLLMTDNLGKVNNNGSIQIHKTTTTLKRYDYTYWSSPVKNALLKEVFAASPQNSFYSFETQNFIDTDNNGSDDDENAWQSATDIMETGKGYTAMAPNTSPFIDKQTVVFKGTVNNGILTIPAFLSSDTTNAYDDWNFIGNPYPSALNAEMFLNNENNKDLINGSVYFWTHNTMVEGNKYSSDDYAMYTVGTGGISANSNGQLPTEYIASCQGFFVEAKQTGDIVFNNEMRVATGNNNFFKRNSDKNTEKLTSQKPSDKIWLNLHNTEGVFSQILIGFIDGATPDYESNFDGIRLNGNNYASFFSIVKDQHLAIQGTSSFTGDETIELGIFSKVDEAISLKIGIDHLEGLLNDQEILLKDLVLNKTHRLNDSDYEFTLDQAGFIKDRFLLTFHNASLNIDEHQTRTEDLIIKKWDTDIHISTSNKGIISSLIIYDILGKRLITIKNNRNEIILPGHLLGAHGLLIVHAKLENSQVLIKKFIK